MAQKLVYTIFPIKFPYRELHLTHPLCPNWDCSKLNESVVLLEAITLSDCFHLVFSSPKTHTDRPPGVRFSCQNSWARPHRVTKGLSGPPLDQVVPSGPPGPKMDLMGLSGPTGPKMGVQIQKLCLSFYTSQRKRWLMMMMMMITNMVLVPKYWDCGPTV